MLTENSTSSFVFFFSMVHHKEQNFSRTQERKIMFQVLFIPIISVVSTYNWPQNCNVQPNS